MKKKNLLMTAIAIFGLATITIAQVPSYVPTNGLVGWWPFNGNANDESGNGNNGTNNGATLTTDRFGNSNSAYDFNGLNNLIRIPHQNSLNLIGDYSISVWYKGNYQNIFNNGWVFIAKRDDNGNCCSPNVPYQVFIPFNGTNYAVPATAYANGNYTFSIPPNTSPISLDQWQNLIITNTSDLLKFYINGELIFSENISSTLRAPNTADLLIGSVNRELGAEWMNGKLDDIGIWNRALTQEEITNLYNGCQLTVNTQPNSQTININNNAQFEVGSSDPSATFQWQTDLGVGFQNLNSVGLYSGTTTNTLTVSNVTLSNNNQQFRCIISSGSCSDTSNVAVLTVNNNVGINETTQDNIFTVFPNPAQSIINVKADNKLIGDIYTIYDNTGRVVLTGKINAQNTTIELGNLSGGIYLFIVGENMKQTFKIIKE
jgi:hypothetical protein